MIFGVLIKRVAHLVLFYETYKINLLLNKSECAVPIIWLDLTFTIVLYT